MSGPQKYRPKAQVEARQVHSIDSQEPARELARWCDGYYDNNGDGRPGWISVFTDIGHEEARTGDWIVRSGEGNVLAVLDDAKFAATYEAVSEPRSGCGCGQPVDAGTDVTVHVEGSGFWHRACAERADQKRYPLHYVTVQP